MQVKDIMQKNVDTVSTSASVRDLAHIIFGRNINGVPVCKDRKVVGFVTESDILKAFYPSMQDVVDDPVRSRDFEEMEERAGEILSLPVEKIMSKNPRTIKADTPMMRAQSVMATQGIGRLPVVDSNNKLIGIVAQGDIFRTAIGQKIPLGEEEKFYDWLAHHYDILVDWDKRLAREIPDIVSILKKENAISIVDVGSSTGEHSIAFAKKGFNVHGLETSQLIGKISQKKREGLPSKTQDIISFHFGKYKSAIKDLPGNHDAAIFMGNALAHTLYTNENILKEVVGALNPKKSTIILQLHNLDLIMKKKFGAIGFISRKTNLAYEKEHGFLSFYTEGKQGKTVYNQAIFDSNGDKWAFQGMRSAPVVRLNQKDVSKLLGQVGFKNIKFYGSHMRGNFLEGPFKVEESDMMNVVAKRK